MISVVLRNLLDKTNAVPNFKMHVCLDGNIFLDEIEAYFSDKDISVFVMVPLMIGIDDIQPQYLQQVKYLFQVH
jgi:hypothetical protein